MKKLKHIFKNKYARIALIVAGVCAVALLAVRLVWLLGQPRPDAASALLQRPFATDVVARHNTAAVATRLSV